MKPYLIYAPEYTHKSAGVLALYRLCQELNKKGYEGYTTFLNPLAPITDEVQRIAKEGIVVYPETVVGNPLNAERVVRWILYTPGAFGGQTEFNNEIIFSYNKIFYDADLLQFPLIDTELFKDENLPRKGELSYKGKGKPRELPPTTEITNQSKKELAHLLKTSTLLHSLDEHTQLITEANLCGCPVLVYTDKGTIVPKIEDYNKYIDNMKGQLDNFINKTQ